MVIWLWVSERLRLCVLPGSGVCATVDDLSVSEVLCVVMWFYSRTPVPVPTFGDGSRTSVLVSKLLAEEFIASSGQPVAGWSQYGLPRRLRRKTSPSC